MPMFFVTEALDDQDGEGLSQVMELKIYLEVYVLHQSGGAISYFKGF